MEVLSKIDLRRVIRQNPPLYRQGNRSPERGRNLAKMHRELKMLTSLRMEEIGIKEILETGKDARKDPSHFPFWVGP